MFALQILGFVICYKLADNLAGALVSPFLQQMGYDATAHTIHRITGPSQSSISPPLPRSPCEGGALLLSRVQLDGFVGEFQGHGQRSAAFLAYLSRIHDLGIVTIAKGTVPLVFFGARGYGARQGWMMMPARATQALAPFVFGLAVDRWGANALWLSAALGVVAFGALMLLPDPRASAEPAAAPRR